MSPTLVEDIDKVLSWEFRLA